jgi:hypothetical protein
VDKKKLIIFYQFTYKLGFKKTTSKQNMQTSLSIVLDQKTWTFNTADIAAHMTEDSEVIDMLLLTNSVIYASMFDHSVYPEHFREYKCTNLLLLCEAFIHLNHIKAIQRPQLWIEYPMWTMDGNRWQTIIKYDNYLDAEIAILSS